MEIPLKLLYRGNSEELVVAYVSNNFRNSLMSIKETPVACKTIGVTSFITADFFVVVARFLDLGSLYE